MPEEFPYDVFLSRSAIDAAAARLFVSLSASTAERARVRRRFGDRSSSTPLAD